MDTAVRVDETGSGALVGGGGFGLGRGSGTKPARSSDGAGFVPSRRFGSRFADGTGAASASAPSFATAQMVFAGVAAAVLAFRCVVAPRMRRARLAGQLATRGARKLSP
jgi:hypothetical protein